MNEARLAVLVERYFDRELTVEDQTELQALLRESAPARAFFWEAAEWQALYRQWGEQEWGRLEAESAGRIVPMPIAPRPMVRPRPQVRAAKVSAHKVVRFPFAKWTAALAAVAAVVAIAFTIWPQLPGASVATLAQVSGAVWSEGSAAPAPGARLKPGRLRLERGTVVLAFGRGARVVLEGPAEFELRSDNAGFLHSGKLRARVPVRAHGFKIETAQFTAVDLGTEFGCELAPDGAGELHVFAGKVELNTAEAPGAAMPVREDQAMRIEGGSVRAIAARPDAFVSEDELARRELVKKGDVLGAWRMASRQLSDHPATLLHLDFEGISATVVPNRASRAPAHSDPGVVGGKWVEGRWPGKSALEFQDTNDRLRVALPGRFESLTLLAWVRAESLHAKHNALLMGHTFQLGEVHWYLYGDGSLGLGVLRDAPGQQSGWQTFHSPPIIGAQEMGAWNLLASVFDGPSATVTHYFNGQPVGSRKLSLHGPLRLDAAEIGNWAGGPDDPRGAPRKPSDASPAFHGRIDELAILTTALGDEQIQRLYQQGKPGGH
ncbi:MAG: hypothetical protein QOE70_2411 [Chthoniobacter sp.]|jgi:hypothetical protein|nr:hypothetical protein [Chthoniobacter sp.]